MVHVPTARWVKRQINKGGGAVNEVVYKPAAQGSGVGENHLGIRAERFQYRSTEQTIQVRIGKNSRELWNVLFAQGNDAHGTGLAPHAHQGWVVNPRRYDHQ